MKKEKNRYGLYAFVNLLALFLPCFLYMVITTWIFPSPNSGFLILGYIGNLILGLGFVNIAGNLSGMYLGNIVTFSAFGVGSLLITASSLVMYVPAIYSRMDESIITFYFIIWIVFAVSGMFYMFFRYAARLDLRKAGLSKTAIKKAMKGIKNYWWYEALKNDFNHSWVYRINKLFTMVFPLSVCLHLFLGWLRVLSPVITGIVCLLLLLNSVMYWLNFVTWNIAHSERPNKLGVERLAGFIFPIVACVALIIYLVRFM